MVKKRHKWSNYPETIGLYPDSYRIEKCIMCGMLKLHRYVGRQFFMSYIFNGKSYEILPECTNDGYKSRSYEKQE